MNKSPKKAFSKSELEALQQLMELITAHGTDATDAKTLNPKPGVTKP